MTIAVGDHVWVPADRNHHIATVTDASVRTPGRWRIEWHVPHYQYGWWDESSLKPVPADVWRIFHSELPGAAGSECRRLIRELAADRDHWRSAADQFRAAWHDAEAGSEAAMAAEIARLDDNTTDDRHPFRPAQLADGSPTLVCRRCGHWHDDEIHARDLDWETGKVTITPQDVPGPADT